MPENHVFDPYAQIMQKEIARAEEIVAAWKRVAACLTSGGSVADAVKDLPIGAPWFAASAGYEFMPTDLRKVRDVDLAGAAEKAVEHYTKVLTALCDTVAQGRSAH